MNGSVPNAWHLLTRLGEAQILLPAAALVLVAWLWGLRTRAAAAGWVATLGTATALTTASKVAFIGFGLGIAAIDFTGFSGHAMFAAAVLPVVVRAMMPARLGPRGAAVLGGWLGYGLAIAIAVSRVEVGAHSVSEVVAGFALGAAASAVALHRAGAQPHRLPWPVPWLLVAWLVWAPLHAPPTRSHDVVTRLSLWVAQRDGPFHRWELHLRRPATHPLAPTCCR